MDNQSQQTLWTLSDERDAMQPFRDLCRAQADALAGRDDETWSPEFGPF